MADSTDMACSQERGGVNGTLSGSAQVLPFRTKFDPFLRDRQSPFRSAGRLLKFDDVIARPSPSWLVKQVLPTEGLGAIFGPPGCGKSFIALDLLGAISRNVDWFGRKTRSVGAVYVAVEGRGGLRNRFLAYKQRYERPGILCWDGEFDIRDIDACQSLIDAIRNAGAGGGVLIIDTLNQAAPGMDENSSADMGEVIASLRHLQVELGGLVLVVHHTGKDVGRGLRGHSSLLAALDVAIEVKREAPNSPLRNWSIAKQKDGDDGISDTFQLDSVRVGLDDDGEPITSCIVVRIDGAGVSARKLPAPSGKNQRSVWAALEAAVAEGDSSRPPNTPKFVPNTANVLSFERAIELGALAIKGPITRRKARAIEALDGLQGRGFFVRQGEVITWMP